LSIPLIAFSQENAARLLVSHLKAHGIEASYEFNNEFSSQGHLVCLLNLDDAAAAKLLTQKFVENPNAPEYQQDAWETGEQSSKPVTMSLSAFNLKQFTAAPLSLMVAGVCIFVFLLMAMGGSSWVREWMFIQPLPTLVTHHQWWRLFSPDFIHFSAMHLVFNVLWWLILGAKIERLMGLSTLLIVLLTSSLVSNIGQLLVSGPNFGGLSGVVYALLGFVWWVGWLKPQWNVSIPKPIVGFMLVWLVIGYADIFWFSTANTAHTLGLVSGCLLAVIYSKFMPTKES
jgi:GlpG protein